MNQTFFLLPRQPAAWLLQRGWRTVLVSLLLCQTLWLLPQPVGATPVAQLEGALDTPFAIAIGEEVQIVEPEPGIYVFLAAVLSDDRCLTGSACVQAGAARFQLIISDAKHKDAAIEAIGTAAGEQAVQYQGYTVELVEVNTPAPKAGENFILLDYQLTLVVSEQPAPTPTPTPVETPPPPAAAGLEPVLVDSCPNFTPYDAGAILQELVNAAEPIGNVIFGPLPEAELAESMNGLCGYTNLVAADEGADNSEQTHLATALPYRHVVVADHLTANLLHSSSGLTVGDWLDLIALAQVVSAANPQDDGQTFDALYAAFNAGDYASLIDWLYEQASASPSFKVSKIRLAQNDPRDEVLWLWQTLDQGYFALLISRQEADFDLVAARLGDGVTEKTVLGYAQVILEKVAGASPNQPGTDPNQGGASSGGCDTLSLDAVAAILGEPAQGQAVASAQGEGCKYTPAADDQAVDRADFSQHFATHGLLVGVVPPRSAKQLLSGMIEELSASGSVSDGDALQAILTALQAGDFAATLTQMGELAWESNRWQVEPIRTLDEPALLIRGQSGSGWPQFFLVASRADGGLSYLTGVLRQEIDEVRAALITAATQLAAPTPTPPSEEPVATTECAAIAQAEVAELLGTPVQAQAVSGERGAGCKYTPSDEEPVADDDFSPNFASQGALVGVMPVDATQWLLGELLTTLDIDEAATAAVRSALAEGEIAAALHQLTDLKLTSSEWQIEAVPDASAEVVWIHSAAEGQQLSFFFQGLSDGNLLVLALQLSADQEVAVLHTAALAILEKLNEGE